MKRLTVSVFCWTCHKRVGLVVVDERQHRLRCVKCKRIAIYPDATRRLVARIRQQEVTR